jgi:hypothetical protein
MLPARSALREFELERLLPVPLRVGTQSSIGNGSGK